MDFAIDPSARIFIQPTPMASPGCCTICGTTECVAGFLNPQLDFEFYGTVIFCRSCVAEMGRAYKMITESDYHQLVTNNQLLLVENTTLYARIAESEKVLATLRDFYFNSDISSVSGSDISKSIQSAPTNEGDAGSANYRESESNNTDEFSSEQGRDDVLNITDFTAGL